MKTALVCGADGPLTRAVAAALTDGATEVRIAADGDAARAALSARDPVHVLALVSGGLSPQAGLSLLRALGRCAPDPTLDDTGEPRPETVAILVIDHPVETVPHAGGEDTLDAAALVHLTRLAARQEAPRLRVNAIVPGARRSGLRGTAAEHDLSPPVPHLSRNAEALRPTLDYIRGMDVLTGEVLTLRPPDDGPARG